MESGEYRLTEGAAFRIGSAVGARQESLLRNDDPLYWFGQPFSKDSPRVDYIADFPLFRDARR
jgi:hypothetical protein